MVLTNSVLATTALVQEDLPVDLTVGELAIKKPSAAIRVGLIIFPPIIEKQIDDQCHGPALTDIRRLFAAQDLKVNFLCASPSRIYRLFNENKIDLTINVKSTSSLANNVLYSERPYIQLSVSLYTRQDASNKDISSVNKFEYHGMRDKLSREGYEFKDQGNPEESFAVFLRGGTDYLISYKRPFNAYLQTISQVQTISVLDTNFTEEVLTTAPSFFIVNGNSKNAELILEVVNAL